MVATSKLKNIYTLNGDVAIHFLQPFFT